MQQGDLIFVRGHLTSVIDDAIKFGESLMSKRSMTACYSHVAVFVGNDQVAEAQGGRKSGLAPLATYTGDYAVGSMSMTPEQRQKFVTILRQEFGLPYDWKGILYLALHILFGYSKPHIEHRSRYCSKFVEWGLKQVGITVDGTTPETLACDSRIHIN